MEDKQIVDLYWQRDEVAITETQSKYGHYCHTVAYNILHDREDSEEVVNDTWLGAWNAMPPHHPEILSVFLGKIARRLSLKRWRDKTAKKRGGGEFPLALDELEECIPAAYCIDEIQDIKELTKIIDKFLGTLSDDERRVFVCRYWYFDSIRDISLRFEFSQSKVKMMLKRIREKLLAKLGKEGIWV